MGISITSVETDPVPRRNVIELACDTYGCACVTRIIGRFIEARAILTRDGWSETNKRGRRQFICPTCNGIVPTPDLFR